MLKDLKQFVVGSNVAEVGVGLSVGATFTALVAAVVDFAKDGIKGEWAYDGISAAALALLTVVVVSMVGVVKPLLKLRARAAAQPDAEAVEPAAVDAEVVEPVTDAGVTVEAAATEPSGVEAFAADPLHAPIPVQVARNAMLTGPASVLLGATATATFRGTFAGASEVASATSGSVGGSTGLAAVVDLTEPVAPAAPAVPTGAAPFRATELTACPHCAFDVPAAATRCGWCTSDLRVVVTA